MCPLHKKIIGWFELFLRLKKNTEIVSSMMLQPGLWQIFMTLTTPHQIRTLQVMK